MSLIRTCEFIVNHPLNRQRKASALTRFLRWQIGTRILPKPIVFEWMPGVRAILRRGDTGMTQNLYCGLHDFHDMAYLLHMLSEKDLFIDIGANVGAYTLLACGAKGARGYCFEPIPSTYNRLLDNLAINHLGSRAAALNLGLSGEDGELYFTAGHDTMNHILAKDEANAESIKVPVRTLDSILSAESPSMMKIDVEGYETKVLEGAEETLNKPSLHSIIMELNGSGNRYGFDENSILKTMQDYGFTTYQYEPFTRELRSLGGKNNSYGNTLFLRNVDAIREKLARAPRITVGSTTF